MPKKSKNKSQHSTAKVVLTLGLILSLTAVIGYFYVKQQYQTFLTTPIHIQGDERLIQVPKGCSAKEVVNILHDADIIDSSLFLYWYLRRSPHANKFQPGNVVLTPDMTPAMLPEVFAQVGKYARRSVRIRPGMNLYEIADALQVNRLADAKTFLGLALDPAVAAELSIPAASCEGYIAPGIYTFEIDTPPKKMLQAMHDKWQTAWTKLVAENRGAYEILAKRGFSDHALLTLASIVEKEAVKDAERPVIARVFYNRIRKKMKLQSDPTCIYPPKQLGEKPSPTRCKAADNAYSTYVIPALPPGPITTVSLASMTAVFKPYTGPDDALMLYFVARNDGSWTHYFSKTYREHQVAVDHFLKGKSALPKGTTQP